MPYTAGTAGGSVTVALDGTIVLCDAGDGRTAVDKMFGLNVCRQCVKNLFWALQNVGNPPMNQLEYNTVKAFIVTNANNNLQGT